MHPQLVQLVDRIESQREAILSSFQSMTPEQFNRTPSTGKWSAAEILSHIIAAEKLSVMYMQKKVQGIRQAKSSGVWEEIKITILVISQRLPGLKFKAPPRVVENTKFFRDLPAIQAEWENIRKELRMLLGQIPDDSRTRLIYKHPIAGYLNIRQALIFFHEHVYHHAPQLQKLLNQSSSL